MPIQTHRFHTKSRLRGEQALDSCNTIANNKQNLVSICHVFDIRYAWMRIFCIVHAIMRMRDKLT